MRLILNGETVETDAADLAAALDALGYAGAKVATAVNEVFVPAPARAATQLKEGDRIEVLAPMQGG